MKIVAQILRNDCSSNVEQTYEITKLMLANIVVFNQMWHCECRTMFNFAQSFNVVTNRLQKSFEYNLIFLIYNEII